MERISDLKQRAIDWKQINIQSNIYNRLKGEKVV